jgi:hypothetical protein
MFLIAVGIYVYIVIYRNNNFFTNFYNNSNDHDSDEEEFIETPKRVHFSEKNQQFIIPNNDEIKRQQQEQEQDFDLKLQPIDKIDLSSESMYDDIFIVNTSEIKNTNLTLSENEYFNNM